MDFTTSLMDNFSLVATNYIVYKNGDETLNSSRIIFEGLCCGSGFHDLP